MLSLRINFLIIINFYLYPHYAPCLSLLCCLYACIRGFPGCSAGKNLPAAQEPQETRVPSLGPEDPLEEGMAAHSSILAWRISWTEEPVGLQATGPQRVGHD